MALNALALLSGIAPDLFKIIDQVVTDKDLANRLKADLSTRLMDQQSEMAKLGAAVVTAETQGESWLQRNWRPMIMLWFASLIGAYWFGFVPVNMPTEVVSQLFDLVTIGMGGYIMGRSGEKIAASIAPVLGRNKQ